MEGFVGGYGGEMSDIGSADIGGIDTSDVDSMEAVDVDGGFDSFDVSFDSDGELSNIETVIDSQNESEVSLDPDTDVTIENDLIDAELLNDLDEYSEESIEELFTDDVDSSLLETEDEHGIDALDETEVEDISEITNEELNPILDNFHGDKWSDLSLEEQKQSMTDLMDYVANDTGNINPPEITFRGDMPNGVYGGFNPSTNTIEINENMLDDSVEAADTIAHEMWHAYQEQARSDINNPRNQDYQDGFDNYISSQFDYEGYQNQMIEVEARNYAQGFKDRVTGIKGV